MTYKELSEEFSRVWGINQERLDKLEADFMEGIRGLLWRLSADDGEEQGLTESMKSSYDADTILGEIQDLIKKFNEVYHIISITHHWKEDKFKDEQVKDHHSES